MGAAAAPAAAGLSLASMGLKVFGDYEASRGTAAGDQYRAAEMQRAAEYGELKAKQTNAEMTRNLAISLGHLDALRAASHTDPSDPTNSAVRQFESNVGTQQKNIKVASIEAQVKQDEADAAYLRYAGSQALLAGDISMASDVVGGASGAISSYYNPNLPKPAAASG